MPAVRVRFLAPGLFCVLRRPTKSIHEVPMSKSVLLSRSARFCAGRVPLALLLQKLARLGETAAIRALHELPLSPQSRVRWVLCGNALTVEVAA